MNEDRQGDEMSDGYEPIAGAHGMLHPESQVDGDVPSAQPDEVSSNIIQQESDEPVGDQTPMDNRGGAAAAAAAEADRDAEAMDTTSVEGNLKSTPRGRFAAHPEEGRESVLICNHRRTF